MIEYFDGDVWTGPADAVIVPILRNFDNALPVQKRLFNEYPAYRGTLTAWLQGDPEGTTDPPVFYPSYGPASGVAVFSVVIGRDVEGRITDTFSRLNQALCMAWRQRHDLVAVSRISWDYTWDLQESMILQLGERCDDLGLDIAMYPPDDADDIETVDMVEDTTNETTEVKCDS